MRRFTQVEYVITKVGFLTETIVHRNIVHLVQSSKISELTIDQVTRRNPRQLTGVGLSLQNVVSDFNTISRNCVEMARQLDQFMNRVLVAVVSDASRTVRFEQPPVLKLHDTGAVQLTLYCKFMQTTPLPNRPKIATYERFTFTFY